MFLMNQVPPWALDSNAIFSFSMAWSSEEHDFELKHATTIKWGFNLRKIYDISKNSSILNALGFSLSKVE